MILSAPICLADSTPSKPTAPSPTTTTVEPGFTFAASAANHPVPMTSEKANKLGTTSPEGTSGVATRVPSALWPVKSEQQKTRLAEAITKDVMDILHYGEESVSVAMEEVKSRDWVEMVYKPDIKANRDKLYKKPGYDETDL